MLYKISCPYFIVPQYRGRKKGKRDGGVCSGIVDHENFEWNMHITKQKVAEFNCANSATAGIKLNKYEKEQWAVQFAMRGYRWR
jgi:hypothetical protein